jgi:hypothetical protein
MEPDKELEDALAIQREQIEWAHRVTDEGLAIQRATLAAQERVAAALERIAAVLEERNS